MLLARLADAHGNISRELQEDLEHIAASKGITYYEAVARYGWHASFGAVVSEL